MPIHKAIPRRRGRQIPHISIRALCRHDSRITTTTMVVVLFITIAMAFLTVPSWSYSLSKYPPPTLQQQQRRRRRRKGGVLHGTVTQNHPWALDEQQYVTHKEVVQDAATATMDITEPSYKKQYQPKPKPLEIYQPNDEGQENNSNNNKVEKEVEKDKEEERFRDVTFASPLLDYGYPLTVEEYESNMLSEKPLLLYLPGFDGTYICPFLQFPELGDDFDVRCMTVSMQDRSTFEELKQDVIDFLLQELQEEVVEEEEEEAPKVRDSTSATEQEGSNWFSGMFKYWPKSNRTPTAAAAATTATTIATSSFNDTEVKPTRSVVTDWFSGMFKFLSKDNSTAAAATTTTTNASSSDGKDLIALNSTTATTAKPSQMASASGAAHSPPPPATTERPPKMRTSKRPVYLAGESFGGILASEVVLTLLKQKQPRTNKKKGKDKSNINQAPVNLQGLALINAATCYDRSQLASKGPPVANLPPLFYPFGLLAGLIPLFIDDYSWEQLLLILQAKALPSVIDTPAREAYMGRVAFSLPFTLKYMPQSTLQWRLTEWLAKGCARLVDDPSSSYEDSISKSQTDGNQQSEVNLLTDFQTLDSSFRTVIIAGEKDLALPSIAEAERLANLLPNSQIHVVEGAGHSSTCGSRIDLAAVLRNRFRELEKPRRQTQTNDAVKSGNAKDNKKGNNEESKDKDKDIQAVQPALSASSSSTVPLFEKGEKKRTAMKEIAAKGKGVNLGLEPRYDGAGIGLNPLRYWSKSLYRPVRKTISETNNKI